MRIHETVDSPSSPSAVAVLDLPESVRPETASPMFRLLDALFDLEEVHEPNGQISPE
jgi:hypothetical protein